MSDFDTVKQQVDIVSYIQRNVSLKKSGSLYKALCPFHPEKTPSFTVNPKTQQWRCWGACGVGGSVIDFAMKYHHLTEAEALEDVAKFGNIQLTPLNREKAEKKERLYQVLEFAAQYYTRMLYTDADASRKALYYLMGKRGLESESIGYEGARIGYMPPGSIKPPLKASGFTEQEMLDAGLLYRSKSDDSLLLDRFKNRIMIPLRDHRGRVVGFVGRALGANDDPKYLTGPTTDIFHKSDLIYRPTFRVKNGHGASSHTIVVVEGQMDAISALNRDFDNVLASMGTALTEGQMDQICKGNPQRIVFCLDKDEAGRKALKTLTEKHVSRLASKGIALYAMFAPHGKDPDDTFRERPELWQPAVDAAEPVVKVLIDLEWAKLGSHPSAVDVSRMVNDLLPILKSDNPPIEDENLKFLHYKTEISLDRLKNWLVPQMHVVKPAPVIAAPAMTDEPPLETAILWGILFNEHDHWLQRANAALIRIPSLDQILPYAFAPLSPMDFTHTPYQQLMGMIVEDLATVNSRVVNTPLYEVYRRVTMQPLHTSAFAADTPQDQPEDSYEEFIEKVMLLRLNRLKSDMKQGKNFREAMIGTALIQEKLATQF